MNSKLCKYCGNSGHSSWKCFKKARKPLNPIEEKTAKSLEGMKRRWLRANPPNSDGGYVCYLQISEYCPKNLNQNTMTYEHVIPKTKAPELKYDISNIRPACNPCNKLKGGKTLEELAIKYPHLAILI